MTALTEFLFPAPAHRSTGQILRWWESRRLPYNLMVGSAGVFSLVFVRLVSMLPPGASGLPFHMPWIPIAVFAGLANICYLLGPTVEVITEKLWGRQVLPVGPALFRMGLTFSVGLALLPTLLVLLAWVYRIVVAVV